MYSIPGKPREPLTPWPLSPKEGRGENRLQMASAIYIFCKGLSSSGPSSVLWKPALLSPNW